MGVALLEPPLVGLSVHGHEHLAELGEHATGAVRPPTWARDRPAAAIVRAMTSSPSSWSAPASSARTRAGWSSGSCTTPSTSGRGRAGADESGVGALTEQQAEARDDHGLAGAGLTGEHVEPGAQVEDGVVDDADAADPHLAEHGTTLGPGTLTDVHVVHVGHGRRGRRRRCRASRPPTGRTWPRGGR